MWPWGGQKKKTQHSWKRRFCSHSTIDAFPNAARMSTSLNSLWRSITHFMARIPQANSSRLIRTVRHLCEVERNGIVSTGENNPGSRFSIHRTENIASGFFFFAAKMRRHEGFSHVNTFSCKTTHIYIYMYIRKTSCRVKKRALRMKRWAFWINSSLPVKVSAADWPTLGDAEGCNDVKVKEAKLETGREKRVFKITGRRRWESTF